MSRLSTRLSGVITTTLLVIWFTAPGCSPSKPSKPASSPGAKPDTTKTHEVQTESTQFARFGIPAGHNSEGLLLVKRAYECFHSPKLRIGLWVAYRAEGSVVKPRKDYDYFADPILKAQYPGEGATTSDWQGSSSLGYDHGHQAPDATIKVFGDSAQKETYSLANMTPQDSNVNRGVCSATEDLIRQWSSPDNPIWVAAGPIFFPPDTVWLPSHRVAVPDAYFTVLDRGNPPQVLAFLIPNSKELSRKAKPDSFLVSIDSIQRITGLNFLTRLPDSLESELERARPETLWR